MKKFQLDLSRFKKIGADEHTSILRHEDGHELRIDHKKLNPKLKGQLDKLPMGSKKDDARQKFADGGDTLDVNLDPNQLAAQAADARPQAAPMQDPGDQPFTGLTGSQPIGTPANPGAEAPDTGMLNLPPDATQATNATQNPGQSLDPGSPAPDAGRGLAAQSGPSDPYGMGAYASQELGALGQQQAGNTAAAKAEGALGQAKATQEAGFQSSLHDAAQTYQSTMDHLLDQDQKVQSDLANGHFDPNAYIKNMTTGGQIATGIGLILGGMGAGLTHGPNMAFEFLQSQINRDLDAQKAEVGKKENLLSHNIALMGNARAGYEMTRLQLNDVVGSQIRMEADKAATPIAAAQAQIQNGLIGEKKAQTMRQIALLQSAQRLQQGTGNPASSLRLMQMSGMITPQQYESGNKELEKGMETEKLRGDLTNSFQDLSGKALAGKFSPEDRNSAINAFAGRLAKISEGRFNLDESKQQVAAIMPTGLESAQTRMNKLQRLNMLMDGQVNTPILNGMGLSVPKSQPAAQPQYKMSGGVKYMRGPNGEAVRVK